MREMTKFEKMRRGYKAVTTVVFKVALFGGATAVAMWVWHYFTAHPHPFEHYFIDNSKMALYIEALKALGYEAWDEAGAEIEDELADKVVDKTVEEVTKNA